MAPDDRQTGSYLFIVWSPVLVIWLCVGALCQYALFGETHSLVVGEPNNFEFLFRWPILWLGYFVLAMRLFELITAPYIRWMTKRHINQCQKNQKRAGVKPAASRWV